MAKRGLRAPDKTLRKLVNNIVFKTAANKELSQLIKASNAVDAAHALLDTFRASLTVEDRAQLLKAIREVKETQHELQPNRTLAQHV